MIVSVDTATMRLSAATHDAWCIIGRSGSCPESEKREGDGRTPIGSWRFEGALIRPDRGLKPPAGLPWRWLRLDDGWSDDPLDPAYNRPVRHPHPFSAERLWRDDALYDAILLLGHNAHPPAAGAGSAIFVHIAEGSRTQGCVAVARDTMSVLLETIARADRLEVRAG